MDDPQNAFPSKVKRRPTNAGLHKLKKELERVKEEREILKKALDYFGRIRK